MTYIEITEALREAEREPQQTTKKKKFGFRLVFLSDPTPETEPEPENKTRNPTRIFSCPSKTCRVRLGFQVNRVLAQWHFLLFDKREKTTTRE